MKDDDRSWSPPLEVNGVDTGPSLRPLLPAVVVVACGSKLTSRSLGGRRPAKSELVDTQPASRTRPTCGQELRASIQRRKKKSRNHVYCMYKAPAPLACLAISGFAESHSRARSPHDNKRSILFRFHVIFLASRSRCPLAAENDHRVPPHPQSCTLEIGLYRLLRNLLYINHLYLFFKSHLKDFIFYISFLSNNIL